MNRIVTSLRHRLRHDGEHGAVSVYAVIIAAVLMLMAGLCIEGGRVLNARATLADQAEQAARAGAQHLSTDDVRGGATVSVDSAAATSAARTYLAQGGLAQGGLAQSSTVDVTSRGVAVTVERDVPTTMLRLVGVTSIHVTVTGEARNAVGIFKEDQ